LLGDLARDLVGLVERVLRPIMLAHRAWRRGLGRNIRRGCEIFRLSLFLRKEKPTEYGEKDENNKDPHALRISRA